MESVRQTLGDSISTSYGERDQLFNRSSAFEAHFNARLVSLQNALSSQGLSEDEEILGLRNAIKEIHENQDQLSQAVRFETICYWRIFIIFPFSD